MHTTSAALKVISLARAASMLQPFMRQNAAAWLLADQLHAPQIRAHLIRGKRYYSASDVAAYIVRFLDPNAVIDRSIPRDASFAQRKRRDRRVTLATLPLGSVDRRDPSRPDRRLRMQAGCAN